MDKNNNNYYMKETNMTTENINDFAVSDNILREDIARASEIIPEESLKNKSILVTGATGLIGSHIVKTLLFFNHSKDSNIKVYALVRNAEKARRVFGDLCNSEDFILVIGDVSSEIKIDERIDFVIHGASPTSSRFFVNNPVETIMTAIEGTRNLLEFSKNKGVEGFVYLSSLEVYGVPANTIEKVSEKDYGYLDPIQVRSSYSESKRLAECLVASYAEEYGVKAKIARLSQTFGPGVEYNDGRVFAEFARCAIEGRDIVLHTEGKTVRTYCYTKDAVTAILTILVNGKKGEAYNVTNPETKSSIREMAEMVAGLFPEKNLKVNIEIPENSSVFGYNPEMVIVLDNAKLCSLGWKPTIGLKEMFKNTISSMLFAKEDI